MNKDVQTASAPQAWLFSAKMGMRSPTLSQDQDLKKTDFGAVKTKSLKEVRPNWDKEKKSVFKTMD